MREAVALIALAVILAAAVMRWRRAPGIWEFVRLGVLTVPLGLLTGTVALWLALHAV